MEGFKGVTGIDVKRAVFSAQRRIAHLQAHLCRTPLETAELHYHIAQLADLERWLASGGKSMTRPQ